MARSDKDLLRALSIGPAFLFLGQASAAAETGRDEYQTAVAQRLGLEHTHLNPWGEGLEPRALMSFYEALAAETSEADAPDWLEEIATFPWNGVFTSRIDAALDRAFKNEWRTVVPTSSVRSSRHNRNPAEMRLCHLFGGVALADEEQPPRDLPTRAARKRNARENLALLTSRLVTPRGVLVIDGYSADDWLTTEDLYAAIAELSTGQAHMFSIGDLASDVYIAAAISEGRLVVHSESLSLFLSDARQRGQLRAPVTSSGREQRVLRKGVEFVAIERNVWNEVLPSARPIDEAALQPYPRAAAPVEYQRFHEFLGQPEGAPLWQAIASEYQFPRDFEVQLRDAVRNELAQDVISKPLILAGQTSTGKTTAMMALAVQFGRAGECAVLYVPRRGDRPSIAAIDRFALWAEEHGFLNTLVLWDGMLDPEEYFGVHRQLRARGRRVVVVGTTYVQQDDAAFDVLAPATLSASERTRFGVWLSAFGVSAELPSDTDTSILAALYRLLPSSRRSVEKGLTLEVRTAEETIERRARTLASRSSGGTRTTTMAEALIRAGLVDAGLPGAVDEFSELRETRFLDRSGAEQLTSLVLTAGRHGLTIPLDLVLRVLGREGSVAIIEAMKTVDIIRWSSDDKGDQYIGARTTLEAELLARLDLAGPPAEMEVVAQFVLNVRQEDWAGGGAEIEFLVDLFNYIGPQGREVSTYLPHMRPVLDAFQELHDAGDELHPRLVLIEANLIREYVKLSQNTERMASAQRLAMLGHAQEILEDALERADPRGRGRLNLLVELASALGAQAYERTESGETDGLEQLVERILDSVLAARAADPENYYPVDVLAWVSDRMLSTAQMEADLRTDLLASALSSFDSINPEDLSPKQRAHYHNRLAMFARHLDDPEMERENLDRLRERSDPAAYYLLARTMLGGPRTAWSREAGAEVLDLLRTAPAAVRSDWRCGGLLLDVFWWTKTGNSFMRGERQAVAFSEDDWNECLEIAALVASPAQYDRIRLDFLRGLAWFHLGSFNAADAVFAELDSRTAGLTRRVIATFLASDENGKPRVFDGLVRSVYPDGRRGRVWVDDLRVELTFIPYRFSGDPIRRGDVLSGFHIAFNLRGYYADPVRTSRQVSAA
ncbi:hypothetical protein [Cellulomonas hominis]|uniref:hypothetical protein n=1 Tax=Cellulomonas hominis TaxID=156981 RepID=UPI001443E991|nr:hypothetical protein [Cellulomonas hominis]NKY08906.1 hypothetical protein [Cellulomonas hominis]